MKQSISILSQIAGFVAAIAFLLFMASESMQKEDIVNLKEASLMVLAADRAPDCATILAYEDPLKRHIFSEIICEGKTPDEVPEYISDEEADKLTPRYP